MDTIVKKLNEISTAMGGQTTDENSVVKALDEIKQVAGSGGGSGAEVFYFAVKNEELAYHLVDVTYAEIYSAIESGRPVCCIYGSNDDEPSPGTIANYLHLCAIDEDFGLDFCGFSTYDMSSTVSLEYLRVNSDGTVSYRKNALTLG